MVFKKPMHEVEYSDITSLKDKQVRESGILDYKKEFSLENKDHLNNLLKLVSAFSNTSGGFLIYGVEETGRGGYPKAINGIDIIDHESLERSIIDCIKPRIRVIIKPIEITENPDKIVLVIQIPEGQSQPYIETKSNQYYKRYNFSAMPMHENEIEALYRKRFFGLGKLSKYVDDTIFSTRILIPKNNSPPMDAHFIITPLKVDKQIINSSKLNELDFDLNKMRFEPKKSDIYLGGVAKPSRYGIRWISVYNHNNVEVHRNGLIHCMEDFGESQDGNKLLWTRGLAIRLLQTIQFSAVVYSKLNFVGKVKIIFKINNAAESVIPTGYNPSSYSAKCETDEIYIEREWDSWRLTEDYLEIGRSIIDELSNYYGLWFNSLLFTEEEGNFVFKN